jgi:hypothetical protein
MFFVQDEKGRTIHWGAAIDEGYGPKPYIDLTIKINGQLAQWKLDLGGDAFPEGISEMLLSLSSDIKRLALVYHERADRKAKAKVKRG